MTRRSPGYSLWRSLRHRIWRDLTISLIGFSAAIVGVFIALLFSLVTMELTASLISAIPLLGASLWIGFKAWRAKDRRTYMRASLQSRLSQRGENAVDVMDSDFPDIPVWVSGSYIYYAGDKELESQPLDQLLWAYADDFLGRPYYQLVIWNRNARAAVLPLREDEIDTSLDILRDAIPWLPVGYSDAMKISWNQDHEELVSLIDEHRQTNKPFDAPWAGTERARVLVRQGKQAENLMYTMKRDEMNEIRHALRRWNVEPDDDYFIED